MHNILRKIFRKRTGRSQVIIAGFGFVVGLLLLLVSTQFYLQITRLLNPKNNFPEYIVLSKEVGWMNTVLMSKVNFTEEDIEELKKQDFVESLGKFTSNQFEIFAYFDSEVPFTSELFFEAVPDKFLDKKPSNWTWKEGDDFIPIILSQDMLNLYNFAYAPGKGLPQIPRSAASLVSVKLAVKGEQGRQNFNAKIVGFTDRIPSVIVPNSFMEWANRKIGENKLVNPSRLIVKVNNPSNPKVLEFFKKKNYQINEDRLRASKAGGVIQVVMGVIGIVGLFFISLSLIIFMMNFRVIITEAKQEIRLLLQLGYTHKTISRFLMSYFLVFIVLLSIITFTTSWLSINYTQNIFIERGLNIEKGIDLTIILLGLGFVGVVILSNYLAVIRLLKKYN